jgi:uncharacterized protein with PIN domain
MIKPVQFRFYAELNDLLPQAMRETIVSLSSNGDQSVKHLIESLGVPHTEVGRITVHAMPVDFSYLCQEGDQIAVFPISKLNQAGLEQNQPRFILDNHLGRLASYLRMLGFDALYQNDYQDEQLATVCDSEDRILLTRDKRLLMRKQVRRGYWLRSKIPREQLDEVVKRYSLAGSIRPFQRCMRCNGQLVPVRKADILRDLKPLTRQYFNEFHRCLDCDQIYWKGSHYEKMLILIASVLS